MDFEDLIYEIRNGVSWIIINRPDKMNAFRGKTCDELIKALQETLGLTVFMVTHDLDSLHTVCDRIAALSDGKVIAVGTIDSMLESKDPWLQAYFHGKRASVRVNGKKR